MWAVEAIVWTKMCYCQCYIHIRMIAPTTHAMSEKQLTPVLGAAMLLYTHHELCTYTSLGTCTTGRGV